MKTLVTFLLIFALASGGVPIGAAGNAEAGELHRLESAPAIPVGSSALRTLELLGSVLLVVPLPGGSGLTDSSSQFRVWSALESAHGHLTIAGCSLQSRHVRLQI